MSCSHRERSQGCAAMRGLEVASLPSWTGLPLGRSQRRVSPFLTKSVLSARFEAGRGVVHAVSDALMTPVIQAIMSDNANAHPTDEVPRCPWRFVARVGCSISPKRKDQSMHRRRERVLPGPVPGDSGSAGVEVPAQARAPKGKTSECQVGQLGPRAQLAARVKATKWPDGTSSCHPIAQLRNRLIQPSKARLAVRQH